MTDRSAVGKRSRRKGVTYERKIARLFREAGFPMVRTPLSGGWKGALVGDLIPDPDCPGAKPFVVECKKGAQVPALDSMFEVYSGIVEWYSLLEGGYQPGGVAYHPDVRFPVLVFARDRGTDFALCRICMLDSQEARKGIYLRWGAFVVLTLHQFLRAVRRTYEMREMRARSER